LVLEVENVNESLTTKDLDKLFERFYQFDKNSEGVGIGLSLIKELTVQCRGSVKVKKNSPETISFVVSIPIEKEKYNTNVLIKEKISYDFINKEPVEIFIEDPDEIPILLVVEDNEEVRKYIVSIFSEMCTILEAKDGLEGIKIAIREIPDLIISDIMMPNKDGIELCNTLKEDTRTCHIPIMLVTAKADISSEIAGLRSKADDYITKPFNSEVIKQKVINNIENRRELRKRYSQNIYLQPKDIAVVSLDETFLENVQELIDTRFTDSDFTSNDFSKEMNLSRMQLHRKLKAITGLSTSEFIRSQRLKSAIKLIETSDLTVSEIAYSVGFNTPSYFTKCFKEAFNCNPTEYKVK
jgi:YesN/AraC family two-component response regulator